MGNESQLGQNQKNLLYSFTDTVEGKPVRTIKELAKYLFCQWDEKLPTKEQINEVHRIVRSLKKRDLVKTWFAKPGYQKIDFKYHPGYYKTVALRSYKGSPYIEKEE